MQVLKKTGCIAVILLLHVWYAGAQTDSIEKWKYDLTQLRETDTTTLLTLSNISFDYQYSDIDSMLSYAKRAYLLLLKYPGQFPAKWPAAVLSDLGFAYWQTGNYPEAKETYFKALEKAELLGDSLLLANIYNGIGIVNRNEGEYRQALVYFSRAEAISRSWPYSTSLWSSIADKGKAYEQLDILDSAFLYAKQALAIQEYKVANGHAAGGGIYANMAIVYSKLGNSKAAVEYFDKAINAGREGPRRLMGRTCFEYAEHCYRNNEIDAAITYAHWGLEIDQQNGYWVQLMDASKLLAKIYTERNIIDSAFKYQSITISTNERLFSRDKLARLQGIEFNEQLRLQEKQAAEMQATAERKENIEYVLIALGLLAFIMFFLLLSRAAITNTNIIRFVSVLGLLFVFEFFNLLLHPLLEKVTQHSPFLMLLALVCLSALLIPAHHKLEKWAINKLVAKNKDIRLANARRTIEELGKQ